MNKISEITEGTSKLSFDYGINQERREMKTFDLSFNPPKLKKKKFYSGDYEKEVKSNGDSIEWNYIYGGDGLTAIYRVVNGTGTLYNVAKDHLGSIMALYDNNGNTVEEYSYDAWGRRRDPGTWNLLPRGSDSTYLVSRGYTQHEHLGAFDLINMNGRLYDPIVGRMLSPDILVQDPTSSQGFNRYSYVLNNSLKYVDPSGYAWQYFRYVFGDGVRNLRSFGIWIKRWVNESGDYETAMWRMSIMNGDGAGGTAISPGAGWGGGIGGSGMGSGEGYVGGGIYNGRAQMENLISGGDSGGKSCAPSSSGENLGTTSQVQFVSFDGNPCMLYPYHQENEAYMVLWAMSHKANGEWASESFAILTNKGVLILPNGGFLNGKFVQNKFSRAYYAEGWLKSNVNNGSIIGTNLKVIATLHTHPWSEEGISPGDMTLYQYGNIYVIDSESLHLGYRLSFNSQIYQSVVAKLSDILNNLSIYQNNKTVPYYPYK